MECYNTSLIGNTNLFRAENPVSASAFIEVIVKLIVFIIFSRTLSYCLRPLRLPEIVAQICVGVLIGPFGIGSLDIFQANILSPRCATIIEGLAQVGLLLNMFFRGMAVGGLNYDKGRIWVAIGASICGIFIFAVGFFLYVGFSIFWTLAMFSTDVIALAKIVENPGLKDSEIGQTALMAALFTEYITWLGFAGALLYYRDGAPIIFTILFVLIYILFIYPLIAESIPTDADFDLQHLIYVFAGVFIFGFVSEACRFHSAVGGFMLGVIIPDENFKKFVVARVEGLVSEIMMSLFFLTLGWKVDILNIDWGTDWGTAFLLIGLACVHKIVSFLLVTWFRLPAQNGLPLGLMLNTKGVFCFLILCIGRDLEADQKTFSILVIAALIMTALVEPVVGKLTVQ